MSSRWTLDTTKAREAGIPIPIGGILRGEPVNILARHDNETSDVQFNGDYAQKNYGELVFRVSNDCLIETEVVDAVELEPNHEIIAMLAEGPDSQVDTQVAKILKSLKGKPLEEVKDGLHKALDYGARYSMTSSMVMTVLDAEWKRLGGKRTDPAPWQDEMKGSP